MKNSRRLTRDRSDSQRRNDTSVKTLKVTKNKLDVHLITQVIF